MRLQMLFAAPLLLLAASPSRAAEYVVAKNGSDSAAGTDNAAWQTLQHAANQVRPGDRVTVRTGDYAGFHLTTSGTSAAPIEFFAEPGVLINQPNPIRTQHGINLENASHIIVDGFAVTGMSRAGVRSVGVDGDTFASHVTIRNVHAYDNGYWGILTGFVHDLTIENNETSGSVFEHGIYVSNSGDRPVIRNNVSWGNDRNGIHINGDADVGGDGIITGALVSGNVIFDNGLDGGSGINMDGVQNSRIENNLLYNNHASGISLYRIDGGGGSIGNVVVNNTIHQASNGRWALNIQNASTANTALNNILISDHAFRGAIDISADSLSGFVSDYNVVISRFTTTGGGNLSLDQWRAQTGNDAHSFVAAAAQLFVDPANGDYHLRPNSPALNRGANLHAPAFDFEGQARPTGSAIDIGADELAAAILPGDYNRNGSIDAADYVVWREMLGSNTTPYGSADGDGNGIVEPNDYEVWRSRFGQSASTPTLVIVPEPCAAALLVSSVLLLKPPRPPRKTIDKNDSWRPWQLGGLFSRVPYSSFAAWRRKQSRRPRRSSSVVSGFIIVVRSTGLPSMRLCTR